MIKSGINGRPSWIYAWPSQIYAKLGVDGPARYMVGAYICDYCVSPSPKNWLS